MNLNENDIKEYDRRIKTNRCIDCGRDIGKTELNLGSVRCRYCYTRCVGGWYI